MKKRIALNVYLKSFLVFFVLLSMQQSFAFAPKPDYYEIRVYHWKDKMQEDRLDNFLKNALLPVMHRMGVKSIGVFKPVGNDTAADKKTYVLLPYKSVEDFLKLTEKADKDKAFETAGTEYLNAINTDAPYVRMEKILVQAFPDHPHLELPKLTGPKSERIYELRSYESATENYHKNKVKQFNEGGEVVIFNRLGFNAVFYGAVKAGSRMPNLMYLTTFENKALRDEHWKAFSADSAWKTLSAKPEYKNNVSRNETIFMHPTEYSDI